VSNHYAGPCNACRTWVEVGQGKCFKRQSAHRWTLWCLTCRQLLKDTAKTRRAVKAALNAPEAP
jgi:hypothetical protein